MIQTANDIFVLHTAHTTYAFRKLPTGQLEHLYYGRKIHVCEPLDENAVAPLIEKHTFQPGNSCVYDREHNAYTLEDLCLEMSAYGKGDIREPFVELVCEDGSFSSDFVYESSARFEGSEARDVEDALPASYDEKNQVEHLCVTLKDNNSALKLELHYYIYEDCDVITRSAKLINDGVLSQMDMGTLLDYCAIQLNGEKAGGKEAVININFTDTKEKVMLMLKNGVLNHRLGSQDKKADLTMEIAKMDFVKLFFGRTDLQTLRKTNKVKTTGDTKAIDMIRSACEPADPNFNIVLP